MALLTQRGTGVRLAAVLLGFVALVGCGGGDEPAAPRASDSVPSTTQVPDSSTTPPTSTSSGPTSPAATSTTATPPPGATTSRPSPSSTTPRSGSTDAFTVEYPPGWGPSGQVLATAFANGATCGSALIVDRALPADAGPGASIEQSFVQVCWKGLDGKTLAEFMAATYGPNSGFQATTLAGRPAQVSRAGTSSTFFVDTSTRRYQVTAAVAASAELRPTRQAQVERILASLSLPN